MDNLPISFTAGCFIWLPWRRVWYLARVEATREAEHGDPGDTELLVHVHGEPATKDKWLTVHRDGTAATGTPLLQLLQVQPTVLTGIGSLPAVGDRVQLLVMDQKLVQLIASRLADKVSSGGEVPTLVGIVVKVLPARDASLVDVAYPTELQTPDEVQWQHVQIGNGYINVISEARFASLQQQLAFAFGALDSPDH